MFKRKNVSGQAGIFEISTMAVVLGLVLAMMTGVSVPAAQTGASSSGYFPDQFVNQAREIEPMPDTHGDTGLPASFPGEAVNPVELMDAAPQMYS